MTAVEKILSLAEQELGYLEKKSNQNLDNKTANAGENNFTKYSRDLVKIIGSPFAQGVAWCQIWVTWLFVKSFGLEKAKQLLGGWTAYTPTAANYYKKMNRWFISPKVGDQIFFKTTRISHTGLVYKVDNTYVYTIEGNTSSSIGVIPNGGAVCRKKYTLTNSRIAGYGRPDYTLLGITQVKNPYPEPTKSLKKGDIGDDVKWLQYELNESGYCLKVDGEFGKLTYNALMDFQEKFELEIDGICGRITRNELKKR